MYLVSNRLHGSNDSWRASVQRDQAVVGVEIEHIGIIRNPVVDERDAQ